MHKETYEQEVLALALRIVDQTDDGRDACRAECEQVIDTIITEHGIAFPSSNLHQPSDDISKASNPAYAMTLAVGVFAALKAFDNGLRSPAYDFSAVLERRAELVR